jgi:PAS domain S-box-containing protein
LWDQKVKEDIAKRKQAEEALRESEARYRCIVETANEGIWGIGPDLKTTFVNEIMTEMLGYEVVDVMGRPPCDFLFEEDLDDYQARMEYLQGNFVDRFECRFKRKDGRTLWTIASVSGVLDEAERFAGAFGMFMDITERKRAEEETQAYRENLEKLVEERTNELVRANATLQLEIAERKHIEEAFQSTHERLTGIIEFLPDATFVIDHEKRVIAWNRAIEEMTGVRKEEILGKGDYVYSIPFYGEPRAILIDLMMSGDPELEKKYDFVQRKDNTICGEVDVPMTYRGKGAYLWGTASLLRDSRGNLLGAIESIRDITARKNAQDALLYSQKQLRHLSSQLLTAQEEERKRIARDLHDSIGQSLAALKFHVENARCMLLDGEKEDAIESLGGLIPKIQEVLGEARRIYMGLRPSMLDDFGVIATVGWYCREFQNTCPEIHIETWVEIQEDEIPDPLKIVIFRIIQEALNNISKHSGANLVTLSIVRNPTALELSIEDNGAGFDPVSLKSGDGPRKGMGITGMLERTGLSGGAFAIESTPGKGTVVRAHWPLQ